MLDLLKLRTFLAVARTGSFTQAAEQLSYSQSTVSWHIQSLEKEVQVPLFDRLAKTVVLTAAGRVALHYALRIVALADEAKASIQAAGQASASPPAG